MEHREPRMGENRVFGIPLQMMRGVENPFTLVLHTEKNSSLEGKFSNRPKGLEEGNE